MKSNLSSLKFVFVWLMLLLGTVFEAQANIGLAKDATSAGRSVTIDIVVENLHPTDTLSAIIITDDLDAVLGAGNYSITQMPNVVSGPNTLVLNPGYDGGSSDADITTGGSLLSGQTVQIRFAVELTSITDQGLGLGLYSNQASVSAEGPGPSSTAYNDISDAGTDPDPSGNGDAGDAGEDDPTLIDILDNPIIGVAKNATVNNTQVTFDFYLENFGNRTLSSISLVENLDDVFGAGNYSIVSAPSFVDDPGTLTLNAGFNGSGNTELVTSGTLALADTAQISITVDVPGGGSFMNQVTASAQSPLGTNTQDTSDNGTDPDPNGNASPGDPDENDETVFVIGENAIIGIAKEVVVNASELTVDIYLENLGNVTLNNVSIIDDLNAALGAGNFFVSQAPAFIDNPGSLALNPGFNGNGDTELLAGGTLAASDTAQIQLKVKVLILDDVGAGLGVYQNQALAFGQAPGGGITQDESDDGNDADPNGNGNPTEAGENDATSFTVAEISRIGIAKEFVSAGAPGGFPIVELRFTLVNYGNTTISNINVDEDLNAVYGAGNYQHLLDPEIYSGIDTLNYNSAFNGNTNTAMLTSGFLAPGEQVVFRIQHRIISITDQGFGSGIYQNQVTVLGTDPNAAPVSDLSHEGTDPDPNGNGNPTEAGENDPTVISVNNTEVIGIAKDVNVAGNIVTMDFYLENLGNTDIEEIAFDDNLDLVFGPGNYVIETPLSLVDDPGTIALNPNYDGTINNRNILTITDSSLAAGDTAQIRMQIRVTNVQNQGLGIGNYSNQVTLNAFSVLGAQVTDISDNGTDPDPNGNSNPNEAGENDATTFSLAASTLLGVAKTGAVAGFDITYDLYLENLGAETLSQINLIDNLDNAFGAGNYSITSAPSFIVDPGTLTLNPSYDGSANTDLLTAASSLTAGASAQIQFVVQVTTESDQGNGFGIYSNQAVVSGTLPGGVIVSDFSDDGTDPDPNGNNDPADAGEDDPTISVIAGNPAVGISKKVYMNGTVAIIDFVVENLGDVTLTNVIMEDQLNPVFGSSNYSVTSQPTRIDGANTLVLSGQFFGFSVFDIVIGGGFLRPGESERFRTEINITNVADVGNGFGIYLNSVTVNATGPDGTPVSDVSDDGTNPDPSGNGDAGDAGEDDATLITVGDEARLGVAKNVSTTDQQVTFDIYLENLGASTLSTLSLTDDLDIVFGAGNYSLNGSPSFIDDPGTMTLNGGYDGSATTELLSGGSTLAAADTAQIRIIVDVTAVIDQGLGFGQYQNQASASGIAPLGATVEDLSDFGIDPDPNGNGLANDGNESDLTTFTVFPATSPIGVALNATLSGNQVTLDYYIENLGTVTLSNINLVNDLDAVFGAGAYNIISGPTRISAPRNLEPNLAFNGSATTQLIAPGSSISLGVTEQIRLVVEIPVLTDVGSGLGVYSNQVTATGVNPDTSISGDLSDDGTDPDPDGNGVPSDTGENDPTAIVITQDPVPGVAKTVSINGHSVIIDLYLEAFGNVTLSNMSLTEDLAGVFGAGNYSITSAPALIVDPGTLNLNGGFNGDANTDILAAGSTLAIGATARIRLIVNVDTVTDQGSGLGIYQNQVNLSGQAPDTSVGNDLSDNGTDPDPNANDDPSEAGENDATPIVLEGSIGNFIWNDANGNNVQEAEAGINNVTVDLIDDVNGNGTIDGGESVLDTQTTAGGGIYNFTFLPAGDYIIQVTDTNGALTGTILTGATHPLAVTLSAGQVFDTADFGYRSLDTDTDGVLDTIENQVPNANGSGFGDGNGDSTLDSQQSHVSSFNTYDNADMVTIATDNAYSLSNLSAVAPPTTNLPPRVNFPYGLFGFTVNGISAGATVTLDVYVPYNPGINSYWKKGNDGRWYDIATDIVHIGTTKTRITIVLVEGGNFDTDLSPSTLTDPSGPGTGGVPIPVPSLSEWMLILLSSLIGLFALFNLKAYRRYNA